MLFILLCSLDDPNLEASFSYFYENHKKLAFKIAYSYFNDSYTVEEAVQSAFFALSRNFTKICEIDEELKKTYLVKSVRSACIDIIRKSKKQPQVTEQLEYMEIRSESNIQAELENNEKLARIYEAVEKMQHRRRNVLTCKLLSPLSCNEIAEILHLSIGMVKKEIHIGMKELKKVVKEMDDE